MKFLDKFKSSFKISKNDQNFNKRIAVYSSVLIITTSIILFIINAVLFLDSNRAFAYLGLSAILVLFSTFALLFTRVNRPGLANVVIFVEIFSAALFSLLNDGHRTFSYFPAFMLSLIIAAILFRPKVIIAVGILSTVLIDFLIIFRDNYPQTSVNLFDDSLSTIILTITSILLIETILLSAFRLEFDKRLELETKSLNILEERYKAVVENQTELICRFGSDFKVSFANEAFIEAFGSTYEEVSKFIFGHDQPNNNYDGIANQIRTISIENPVIRFETENNLPEMNIYWIQWYVRGIFDNNNNLLEYQAVGTDITNIKEVERKLLEAKNIAENSLKIKGEFVANISHEIRTPLNTVIGMTHLLSDTKLSPHQKKYLDTIGLSSENLLNIINDILDFSKIESGKIELEKNEINLRKFLKKLLDTVDYKAKEKGIDLILELDKELPKLIVGDSLRLNQILLNLISNSIKFTDNGYVKLKVSLDEEFSDVFKIRFEVIDTGIGIPKNKLKKIFDSFAQANNEISQKFGGTGLGLTITKKLIEIMGGEIKVKSRIRQGTTFYFTLQFNELKEKNLNKNPKVKSVVDKEVKLFNVKILIVEDNKLNQFLVQQILESWNIKSDIANHGKEAIELIQNNKYDLILMDLRMPEMDGYSTVKYIRTKMPKKYWEIPIIALTASPVAEEIEKALNIGMSDYLSKPFKPEHLYSKIVQLLPSNLKKNVQSKEVEKKSWVKKETITEKLLNNKYFDLNILKKTRDEKVEFLKKIIFTFVGQAVDGLKIMKESTLVSDWEGVRREAHHLKPSFAYVGFDDLHKLILEIEELAKSESTKDKNLIPDKITEIETLFNQLLDDLKAENLVN